MRTLYFVQELLYETDTKFLTLTVRDYKHNTQLLFSVLHDVFSSIGKDCNVKLRALLLPNLVVKFDQMEYF